MNLLNPVFLAVAAADVEKLFPSDLW